MGILKFAEKVREKNRLRMAVKEALDKMPLAVCYFTATGAVKLCNESMYRLFRKIAQSDLQSLAELNEALDGCDKKTGIIRDKNIFIFPDGSVWQYSSDKVKTVGGEVYTEAIFSDVTELYEKQLELQKQSRELKKMYQELKILSDNVLEITREQEILNMKLRLHDQISIGVAAVRKILRQSSVSKENADAIMQFRRAVQLLKDGTEDTQESLHDFVKDAEVTGVKVNISGKLPDGEETMKLLLAVMREACVNAVRHADASALDISIEQKTGSVKMCITNNGRQPEQEITPRGGLRNYARLIAAAGGSMEIRSRPMFMLTVIVPSH